ncbi:MAG: hypothetical protein QHH75_04960, partial [Bacillota bacterium]|nr:hypothetical protein [Bacillota bacterium]
IAFVTAEQVAASREKLNLVKTHTNDALAAVHAAYGIEPQLGDNRVFRGRYVRQKNRQLHRANPGKGGVRQPANANRCLVNKAGLRIQKYDLIEYRNKAGKTITGYVNTLFSRGAVRIADPAGRELYNGASVNKIKKFQDADTLIFNMGGDLAALPPTAQGRGFPRREFL